MYVPCCCHTNMQASNKPLIAASGAGYEAMVQLLLDKGADINITDQVGLTISCDHLLPIIMTSQLASCTLPLQDHSTALLKACQNKQVSVAKRLCLRNYVDVNAPNKVSEVVFGIALVLTSYPGFSYRSSVALCTHRSLGMRQHFFGVVCATCLI